MPARNPPAKQTQMAREPSSSSSSSSSPSPAKRREDKKAGKRGREPKGRGAKTGGEAKSAKRRVPEKASARGGEAKRSKRTSRQEASPDKVRSGRKGRRQPSNGSSSASPSPRQRRRKEGKNRSDRKRPSGASSASDGRKRRRTGRKEGGEAASGVLTAPSGLLEAPSGLLDGDDDDEAPCDPPSGTGKQAPQGIPQEFLRRDGAVESGTAQAAFEDAGRGGADSGACGGKGKGKGGKGGKGQPDEEDPVDKEEPNFEASGLLGLEDNSKNGIPLKFTVPPEARYPSMKWRIYIFTKQTKEKPKVVHLHRLMGVLFGKDRRVADVPTDHPTCSKQQAVMHFRLSPSGDVRPYILDLESTNGTFLNGQRIEAARYHELREQDVLKFGMSTREFVFLHAGSANHMAIDPSCLDSE